MSSATQSQPQADGDSRPLVVHDLGTMPDQPLRLMHFEVSGPAFRERPASALQIATSIGEVYNAIDRHCFVDLLQAWSRLVRAMRVSIIVQPRHVPEHWFWKYAQESISLALTYCETAEASVRWHAADCILRGEALRSAERAERNMAAYASTPDIYARLAGNAAVYRAFSEGRL